MADRTIEDLRIKQAYPLNIKVEMTKARIREWVHEFGEDGVYISFSGGKDSTVLLDIVRSVYPNIEAVFVNTGLEYPEIQQFVKTFDNVTILRPKMRFDEVITKYGYPVISKEVCQKIEYAKKGSEWALDRVEGHNSRYDISKYKPIMYADFDVSNKCCSVMKKSPAHQYGKETGKKAITGQTAEESQLRTQSWLKNGCNGFNMSTPVSNPLSFWTEQDILKYIYENNLKIASVYGEVVYTDGLNYYDSCLNDSMKLTTTGCKRTGCIFCGFGAHMEKSPNRFEMLKQTHPKQYSYCMDGGEYDEQGIWKPNKNGLGMAHVLDELNKIYGEDFIKY